MAKKHDRCVRGLQAAAGALLWIAGGSYAYADTAGPEEIIVTAQRREQRLQDVPIAVSAFSGATLEHSGITSTSDLATITPSLVWTQALSSATPFIRAVGTNDASAGNESSNALYIDGFYYPSMPGAFFSLSNIERVEVLKGPQGTLFGRNATGGLIQIVTRDPSHEPSLDVRAGYGNYNTSDASVYATAGLGKSVAGDISLYWHDQDEGWGHSLRGVEVNKSRTFAWRSKLKADLGSTSLTLAGDYIDQKGDTGLTRNLLPGATAKNNIRGFSGTIYDTGDVPPGDSFTRQGGVSLKSESDLGFARFVTLSSYREVSNRALVDQDTTVVNLQTIDVRSRDRAFTQELQLLSPAGSKIDWIVGGFYMNRRTGYDPSHAYGILLGAPFAPFNGGFRNYSTVKASSLAAFGQATATVLPRTRLTLGLRYTVDDQHINGYRQLDSGSSPPTVFALQRAQFSKLSWRLSLDHKITDDVLAYFSVNRGFKSGLFNATNPADPAVSPEILDAYEVGLKSTLFDRRLQLNLAAYRYDYAGIQLQRVVGPFTQTYNASSASIQGVDMDGQLRVTNDLSVRGGLSLIPDANYGVFLNAPISSPIPAGGNKVVSGDATGHRMIRAPKITFNLAVDYGFNLAGGRVDTNVTVFRTSSFLWDPDSRVVQPAYTLLNAQVGWTVEGGRYGFTLWAKNITSSKYYVFVNTSAFGDTGSPGAPCTFGASLNAHF